jgi:hypothetical protein
MPESQTSPIGVNSRRSQRVLARVRVKVSCRGDVDTPLSEDTHTSVINAHGALLALAMKVRPGEVLTLRNIMSRDEQLIRVIRVAEARASKHEVAIEFTDPAPHFWHIDFPPCDWNLMPD